MRNSVRKKYVINNQSYKAKDGGSKAKWDINRILVSNGYREIQLPHIIGRTNYLMRMLSCFKAFFVFFIKKDSLVVLQIPTYRATFWDAIILNARKRRKFKLIVFVHDIESLRKIYKVGKKKEEIEKRILQECDVVVCHNENMKKYLISKGRNEEDIITIEIFDYILPDEIFNEYNSETHLSIAYAGNLTKVKSPFVYELSKIVDEEINIKLYGFGYENNSNEVKKMYYGNFSPEKIPYNIEADWGLVWDGNSIHTCGGDLGQYLYYINQHKVSQYLAAGIPVIIWNNAGLAEFVEKNGVGIGIDNLYHIKEILKQISSEEYCEMVNNSKRLAKKLRNGEYTKEVIRKIENIYESEKNNF